MKRRTKFLIAGVAIAVAALAGTGIAIGTIPADDDGREVPITGDALQKASEAALAYTGGGTVTDTEVGDEESLYEVEVRLPDGGQVDVQLDENFEVVSSEADDDSVDD